MTPLVDTDLMPWGKHKGTQMQDVPASYLFWLWADCGKESQTKTCPVAAYIEHSLDALQDEYPDGEW